MATFPSKRSFNGIHDDQAANGKEPSAALFASFATALGHLAGRHRRVIFNQAMVSSMIPAHPAGSIVPLHRLRWNDNWDSHDIHNHRVIAMKLGSFTANSPRFTGVDGVTTIAMEGFVLGETPTEAQHVTYGQLDLANTVAGAYSTDSVSSVGDLRPLSVAIVGRGYEGPLPTVDTANGGVILPSLFASGKRITTTEVEGMADAIALHWLNNRRQFAAYSAPGAADVTTTSALYINLMDIPKAYASRTAATPGVICPIKYCGRMGETTVACRVAVYASCSGGGTGSVKFESSQASVEITTITTAGWYVGSAKLALGNTSVDEYDKVDIFGKRTAGTLSVDAWSITEDPD